MEAGTDVEDAYLTRKRPVRKGCPESDAHRMASRKGQTLGPVEGSAAGRFGEGVPRQGTEDLQGMTLLCLTLRWGAPVVILFFQTHGTRTAPRAGPHVRRGLQLHDNVSVLVRV